MIFLRTLLWLLVLLLGLVIIVPLVFLYTFDPNTYKPQILSFISEKTGQSLQIDGKITLQFFPVVAIKAEKITLPQWAVTIEETDFQIPLRDIIQRPKQLEIQALSIKGLAVSFIQPDGSLQRIQGALHGKVTANTVFLEDITLHGADMDLTGTCTIPLKSSDPITFNAKIPQINIDALLAKTNKPKSTATQSTAVTKAQNTSTPKNQKTSSQRIIQGNVSITQLQTHHMVLHNVKLGIHFEHPLLRLETITADLYEGKLQAQSQYDLLQKSMLFKGKITELSVQSVLQALEHKPLIQGKADLDITMTRQAANNAQGVIKVSMGNGILQGVDVKYVLQKAQALLKKTPITQNNTHQTPFTSLSATLNIQNQNIHNPDFRMIAPDFHASGIGSVDLQNKTLDYKLQAFKQYPEGEAHPNAYPLAIHIQGDIAHPKIEPDIDLYLKMLVQKEAGKQLDRNLQKGLDRLLGSSTENAEDTTENTEKPEDKIKRKLNKELKKGLKKLFKEPKSE